MGYGQTECAPLVTITLYDDDIQTVTETVGLPLPDVQVRIWDLENDCRMPTGEVGEIQVRGVITMKGYYNAEEENKKKFTSDGWLKTTDAGFLDERGYLHFATRISEIIIRHGENISPAEIESVVRQFSDDIAEVKVVGVAEEIVQEEIVCLLQTKSLRIDPDGLKCYVHKMLASYKVPKYIFQLDEIPLTVTGKIDQGAIKRIAEKLVNDQRSNSNIQA
jgi:fatty-acyl-CoA synthase